MILVLQIFAGVTLARIGEWLFVAAIKTYRDYKAKADAFEKLTKPKKVNE